MMEEFAASLRENARDAREATHGPHWKVAGRLPWIGDDIRAVQTATDVSDRLVVNALGDLVEVAAVFDPAQLAPIGGRVQLEKLRSVAVYAQSANDEVRAAQAALSNIDRGSLLAQVDKQVAVLGDRLADLSTLTTSVARAAQLLPPMLGVDGPRDYLLMVQNNAEPRALGGLPGSYVHLRTDDGEISLLESMPAVEVGAASKPVMSLTRAERGLYGTQIGRYPGNVTSTPDFPRAAQLAREFWRVKTGLEVDGVLSVDPVALGVVLGATGPVEVSTGAQLTAENASRILLNQVYRDIAAPESQDAFFASAATAVFDALVSRALNPTEVLYALDEVADEGRLMVWSSVPVEQELLRNTVLSGELRGQVDGSPLVGIFVHDTSGAKIAYYQHVDAEVVATGLGPDGSQLLAVTVQVSSQVPSNVKSLPPLLTGGGNVVPVGNIRSQISVYAPTDGRILDASSTDPKSNYQGHIHNGLMVGTYVVTLEPGQSTTFTYAIASGPGQLGLPKARITPGPAVNQFSVSTVP
ncbi:DUF4012 domain-containing protein [Georgenia muralis]